jgi:hypothetical protein
MLFLDDKFDYELFLDLRDTFFTYFISLDGYLLRMSSYIIYLYFFMPNFVLSSKGNLINPLKIGSSF